MKMGSLMLPMRSLVTPPFHLPIRDVWIDTTGKGKVNYTRRFHFAEVEVWIIATLAGGL